MAQKPLLDGSGYESLVAAESNFTELYDAIQGISTGMPYQHCIFVGKSGSDSNPGNIVGSPKLTFESAIGAAVPGDVIVCVDAGVYDETVYCKAGVDVFAPYATLNGGVYLAEKEVVAFRTITAASGGHAIIKPSGTADGDCFAFVNSIQLSGNANGICCYDAGSTIHARVGRIDVDFGIGIGSLSTNIGSMAIYLGRIILNGAGVAVACNGPTAIISGEINAILQAAGVTGGTAIYCLSGTVSLFVGPIDVDNNTQGNGTIDLTQPGGTIEGGEINDTPIGQRIPAAGSFTTLRSTIMTSGVVISDTDGNMSSATALPIVSGGTGQTTPQTAFNAIKQQASEEFSGVAEIATRDEVIAGTDNERIVTPAGLGSFLAVSSGYVGGDGYLDGISAPLDGQMAIVITSGGMITRHVFVGSATGETNQPPWVVVPADGTPGAWRMSFEVYPGFVRQPQFTFVDVNNLGMSSGGIYHIQKQDDPTSAMVVMAISDMSDIAIPSGGTEDAWLYQFISYDSIAQKNLPIIESADIISSENIPVWDSARAGWYDGDNRCIWGMKLDASGDAKKFFHRNEYMHMDSPFGFVNEKHTTWAEVDPQAPVFSGNFVLSARGSNVDVAIDDTSTLYMRLNEGAATVGLNDNRMIKVRNTAGNTITAWASAYKLGEGV